MELIVCFKSAKSLRTVNLLQHHIVPITRLDSLTTFYETTKSYVQIAFRVWLKHIQTRKYELLLGLAPCKRLFQLICSLDHYESFTRVTWPVFVCKMSLETSGVERQDTKEKSLSSVNWKITSSIFLESYQCLTVNISVCVDGEFSGSFQPVAVYNLNHCYLCLSS